MLDQFKILVKQSKNKQDKTDLDLTSKLNAQESDIYAFENELADYDHKNSELKRKRNEVADQLE